MLNFSIKCKSDYQLSYCTTHLSILMIHLSNGLRDLNVKAIITMATNAMYFTHGSPAVAMCNIPLSVSSFV